MVSELFGAAADFTDTIGNCRDMVAAFLHIADACHQASGYRHHTVNGGLGAAERFTGAVGGFTGVAGVFAGAVDRELMVERLRVES